MGLGAAVTLEMHSEATTASTKDCVPRESVPAIAGERGVRSGHREGEAAETIAIAPPSCTSIVARKLTKYSHLSKFREPG